MDPQDTYPLNTTFDTDFWTEKGVPLQPEGKSFLENVGTFLEGATKPFADIWTTLTGGAKDIIYGVSSTAKYLPVIIGIVAVVAVVFLITTFKEKTT